MASEVYTVEIVTLLDETEVELRPLSISKLRKFMRLWSEHIAGITKKFADNDNKDVDDDTRLTDADLTDAQYDVFIKLCALGLESQLKDDRTEKKFLEYLEDVLDEKTIYRILDLTGGLQLGNADPNLNPPNLAGAGTN